MRRGQGGSPEKRPGAVQQDGARHDEVAGPLHALGGLAAGFGQVEGPQKGVHSASVLPEQAGRHRAPSPEEGRRTPGLRPGEVVRGTGRRHRANGFHDRAEHAISNDLLHRHSAVR